MDVTALLPSEDPQVALETTLCDHCRAPGKVRVLLPSGTDLVFCAHHDREFRPVYLNKIAVLAVLPLDN